MPAPRRLSPARFVFYSAMVIIVALIVWVAVRSVGPGEAGKPTVVLPTVTSPVAAALPSPPAPVVPVSVLPASSPASASSSSSAPAPPAHPPRPSSHPASHSASPSAPRTSPPPSKPAPPAPAASFTAAVHVTSGWDSGYVATVQVTNKGTKTAIFTVRVSNAGFSSVRFGGSWNAQGRQQGTTFVFTGGTLAPGQSASFGFQAFVRGGGRHAQPRGCSVGSGSCGVS